MEQIIYFLVGKAEGQQRLKVVSEHTMHISVVL
jgi:hypothetical protein